MDNSAPIANITAPHLSPSPPGKLGGIISSLSSVDLSFLSPFLLFS
jgi:hypothetical protein